MNQLSEIAFKQIHGDYWLGSYASCEVVMMKSCGWVNATKLCNAAGKRLDNWTRSDHTKELISALQTSIKASSFNPLNSEDGAAVCKYIQTPNITEVDKLITGSYI